MTHHDAVMAVLTQDSGRTYTTGEIVLAIWPGIQKYGREYDNRRTAVAHALRSAEKYGQAERVRRAGKGGAGGTTPDLWRAVA